MREPTAGRDGVLSRGPRAGAAPSPKPLVRNPLHRSNLRLRFVVPVAGSLAVLFFAEPTAASFALGLPLVVAGEAVRIWGAGHLWKTRELVASGPYAHVRHPLYVGTLLASLGFLAIAGPAVTAVGAPLFLLFFFAYYYPYKERGEGKRLERRFGESFRAYRDAVPALLPRLRPRVPAGLARPGAGWSFARVRDNDEMGTALAVAGALALLVLRAALPL